MYHDDKVVFLTDIAINKPELSCSGLWNCFTDIPFGTRPIREKRILSSLVGFISDSFADRSPFWWMV